MSSSASLTLKNVVIDPTIGLAFVCTVLGSIDHFWIMEDFFISLAEKANATFSADTKSAFLPVLVTLLWLILQFQIMSDFYFYAQKQTNHRIY